MKLYLIKSLTALVAALAFAACSEDIYVDGEEIGAGNDSDKICFTSTDISTSRGGSDESRRIGGLFFYNADRTDSIYVIVTEEDQADVSADSRAAYITDMGDIPLRATCLKRTAEGKSYYFDNLKFTKDASGVWSSDPPYWWLYGSTGINFKFYGYAPADIEGATYITDNETWQPKLEYTVPGDVKSQVDILYNSLISDDYEYVASYNKTVPLKMSHALTAVDFRTSTGMSAGTINSVTIHDVTSTGTLDLTTGAWTLAWPATMYMTNYTLDLDKPISNNLEITNDADRTHFLLIPGCNSSVTKAEIKFTKAVNSADPTQAPKKQSYFATLSEKWVAGKKYRYTITISPDFRIDLIDPKPQDAHYVICKAKISTDNMQTGDQWELTATASDGADVTILPESEATDVQKRGFWTDKVYHQEANIDTYVLTDNSARGEATISGDAVNSSIVYIFLPENISRTDDRTITLSMKVKGTDKVVTRKTIRQVHLAWTSRGFGWEQFEDDNEETTWGFLWDRIAVYKRYDFWGNVVTHLPWAEELINQLNAGSYAHAENVYDISTGLITTITIDYKSLNSLNHLSFDRSNGLLNTRNLYDSAGSVASNALESAIQENSEYFYLASESGSNDSNSMALGYVMLKNKYDLLQIETKEGNKIITTYLPITTSDKIKWYLPAIDELNFRPTLGDPWTGEYWSSNPDGDYNALTSEGSAQRMEIKKIRACRRPL